MSLSTAACLDIHFAYPPRVDRTLRYQRYYLAGLERVARVRFGHEPLALKIASSADAKIELESRLQPVLTRLRRSQTSAHVGQYVASFGNGDRTVRFAIDAHDARKVRSPELLEASDLYFKANRWPEDELDAKVVPLVNGNGMLRARDLAYLRSLRGREKDLDLVFISRIWGGREHNLRLFEQLAKLPLRTELHAIFPVGTPAGEVAAGMRRLERLRVRVGTEDLPARELWDMLARAKLVFLRAGKHLCVPWRMIDLLCMGACIVADSRFGPEWPEPLRPGTHYLDCGLDRPADTSPAPSEQYERVGDTVMTAFATPERLTEMRHASGRYFDEHASPGRVGVYIADRVRALLDA